MEIKGAGRPVLAMGAWFKNTLCLAHQGRAYISKTVGDLGTPDACRAHEKTAQELLDFLGEKPAAIAHDMHPDFHSSRFAAKLASDLDIPLTAVQHHHAHIASLCAERGIEEPVLGLALDGVGLGADDTAWGGELLLVEGANFERLGHLRPLPLPGGDIAAQEPWRMAASVLHELGRNAEIERRFEGQPAARTVAHMLRRNLHCPKTSSMGRVFDAASGLLGLCFKMENDAQGAIALENAAASHGPCRPLSGGFIRDEENRLDLLPLLSRLSGMDNAQEGAALFHSTLVEALGEWAGNAAKKSGIKKLALGGGCFYNRLLVSGLRERLQDLEVLTSFSPGDAGISLGQVWVAMAKEKTCA